MNMNAEDNRITDGNVNIAQNLKDVDRRIREACARSGRRREDVTLIAVSKTKPVSMIQEAIAEGIVDFGENKPQELRDKYDELPKDLRWHMIGNLQRNKVKFVVGRAVMIHSVGSLKLAEAIEKEAAAKNIVMPCLVEVNVAGEESKGGIALQDTEEFVRRIAEFEHIQMKGFMTIAPFVEDAELNRVHFRALRNLAVDIGRKNIDNIMVNELSMGMTGDFEVAVEEGATLVRVGTGIFGERNYNI